jgi:hypothetical protein
MILDYPLATAEIGNALLAPQALQYDTELFFGREFLPHGAAICLTIF